MPQTVLLITPPFTQLNTPYPATPQLAGFLKTRGYTVHQADLGIELINRIFSRDGLAAVFREAGKRYRLSPNARRVLGNDQRYLDTIDGVIHFLQYRDNTLARLFSNDRALPRASRFDQLPDLDWSFGTVGMYDRARFLATLYIEDLGDLITEAVTPHFGFSRYAERIALSAHSFAPLQQELQRPSNLLETWLTELLASHIERVRPAVVGITIPFPGNLYAALRCGGWIREHCPGVATVAGGGYVSTELRSLSDPAVFDHLDFITLDDGELPLLNILELTASTRSEQDLTRTFLRKGGRVLFVDNGGSDIAPADTGCPDHSGLPLERYLSLIELANPMHRLWSDGQWNKMTLAHGCYWHKCSFCDTSLDYIRRCGHAPVAVIADRMERVIAQTGRRGFHFTDEAAPPALLKELALELLRRRMTAAWWVNIRFEPAFTPDLCRLLAASGCIAVSGGLETASDRLLTLMNKGVTVGQAAQACSCFTRAGIMVHAYLMYGFPTETAQETVDSLETVRQFFQEGLIDSAFWHRFTATVHSDVGRHPERYGCTIRDRPAGGFAQNDLVHEDPSGCDHQAFYPGLHKAIYNFMHGIGMDFPVASWFPFPVPAVSVKPDFVRRAVRTRSASDAGRLQARTIWLGSVQVVCEPAAKRPGTTGLLLTNGNEETTIMLETRLSEWLFTALERSSPGNPEPLLLEAWKKTCTDSVSSAAFESFLGSGEWKALRRSGLLLL